VRLLNGQAPSELTAILGVLGRPRTELDELPQSTFEPIGYSGVWIDSVRLIAVTGMHELRVFLIPGVMRDPRRAKASRDARSRPGVGAWDRVHIPRATSLPGGLFAPIRRRAPTKSGSCMGSFRTVYRVCK